MIFLKMDQIIHKKIKIAFMLNKYTLNLTYQ
jgi:hypothetical protein